MANYRVGEMLRLTRRALGISQEDLSDGICSVRTLSRMENGKVHVKQSVYKKLMERMGRNGSKAYVPLAVTELEALDLMPKVNTALHKHEYEKAEALLRQMRPYLKPEGNHPLTAQWIGRRELVLRYRLQNISEETYLSELEKLLALTIRDYEALLDTVYPFLDEEVQLLINVAIAYAEQSEYGKAIRINQMLLRSLDTGYMDEKNAVQLKAILLSNTAKYYGCLEEHERAIQMKWDAIRLAKENGLITVFANAYSGIAWSMMEQIEKGKRKQSDIELCKQYLRMGYAAASAAGNIFMKKRIETYYIKRFGDDVYLDSISTSSVASLSN